MSNRRVIVLSLMASFSAMTSFHLQAAGYGLLEHGASGVGYANAGGAARAEDVSSLYMNPAGMTYLPDEQVTNLLHVVNFVSEFHDRGSVPAAGRALGGDGNNMGDLAFVPNFSYAKRITPELSLGLAVNSPFGLKTEYGRGWLGRYQSIESSIKTANINPAIAYKVNDKLSLGLGVSAMQMEGKLTQAINFGPAGDGRAKIDGNDWGFGWNAGAIMQATESTRFGLAYRSKVDQQLDGDVTFVRPPLIPAALAPDGKVKAHLTTPETYSLSVFQQINEQWEWMADMTMTRWSRFKDLTIKRENAGVLSVIPENWDDTVRYALGAGYRLNQSWKFRAGVAYDESPMRTRDRTTSIPGNDMIWLALGARYDFNEKNFIDMAYARLTFDDTRIDNDQNPASGRVRGKYETHADVLSLQFTHNF